jgi:hypothetical protein
MGVSGNEVREQIQRLVQSDLFRLSEMQRRLLAYLAEKSLLNETDQLKEYTIAVDALGKPESYDPRRDSTVRLQLGKLRQRIQEYYRTVGLNDPLLIELPKGRFKLVFSQRTFTAPVALPPEKADSGRKTPLPLIALCAILAGLCLYLGSVVYQLKQARQALGRTAVWEPSSEEFWSPFLQSKDPILICVGTPLFIHLPKLGFFRDSDVNSWDSPDSAPLRRELQKAFPGGAQEPWYFFTGIGEAGGAFLMGNFLTARGFHVNFANSNQVTWNDIGEHDMVLLGPPKFVPQISDLPVICDLTIDRNGIRNLRPRLGEPELLQDTDNSNRDGQSYGLISRLPGLHGKGEILVLGGDSTQGTLAATQYICLERYLRELVSHLRLPSGKLPLYFQAVVSAKIKRGTAVEISYLFHHVLHVTGSARTD